MVFYRIYYNLFNYFSYKFEYKYFIDLFFVITESEIRIILSYFTIERHVRKLSGIYIFYDRRHLQNLIWKTQNKIQRNKINIHFSPQFQRSNDYFSLSLLSQNHQPQCDFLWSQLFHLHILIASHYSKVNCHYFD